MRLSLLIIALLSLHGCTRTTADYHLDNAYKAYAEGEKGFVGLRDGRVLARAPEASQVARLLILGG